MVQAKLESQDLGIKRRQDTCVSIRQHRKVQLLQEMNVNPSTRHRNQHQNPCGELSSPWKRDYPGRQ